MVVAFVNVLAEVFLEFKRISSSSLAFSEDKVSCSSDPVHDGTAFLVPRRLLDVLGARVECVEEVDDLRAYRVS